MSAGCFYICDVPDSRVTKVRVTGEVFGFFGDFGDEAGQMSGNNDLRYLPNGGIITVHLNGRVQKFTRRWK